MYTIKRFPVFFFMLFLVACGFHLRGNIPLPTELSPMYIETTDPFHPTILAIQDGLEASKIAVAKSPSTANTILRIIDIKSTENLISVSASTNTRQYALVETVQIEVTDKTGKVIVPVSTLSGSNPFTVESNQILTAASQKDLLSDEMQQAIVQQLFARLGSKGAKTALE